MRVIIIRNYKKKIALLLTILALWVLMFLVSGLLVESHLAFSIKINDYLSFSYPLTFEVDNIFISDHMKDSTIKTSFSFKKPVKQKFSNYKSLKGKFSFSYPSAFTLSEKEFSGSDILYHIEFHNKSKEAHGFVQVWNFPYDLKQFLEKSKEFSQLNYKYFKTKDIKVNGIPGYSWEYSVLGGNGIYYKGNEVFLSKGKFMYRISFFIPERNWNTKQSKVFWRIVKSFKTF